MTKRFLPLVVTLLTALALTPAVSAAENEVARDQLRTQKAALTSAAMNLTEEQSEKFWPIYREYEDKLDDLLAKRLELIQLYAGNYKIMTDDKAATLARDSFDLSKQRLKLQEDYYKKMSKALGPLLAVRFAQVDNQISTLVDLEIMQLVPLIATPEELGLPPVTKSK